MRRPYFISGSLGTRRKNRKMATVYYQEWRKVDGSKLGYFVYPTIEKCVVDTEHRQRQNQDVHNVNIENMPQKGVSYFDRNLGHLSVPYGQMGAVEVSLDRYQSIKSTGFVYVESLVDLRA